MKIKTLYFIFLFTVSLSFNVQAAQVYKWVDEDGQVHYGSKPKSKNAKQINIKNRYIDSGSSSRPLSAQQRAEKQKKFVDALTAEEEALKKQEHRKKEKQAIMTQRCNYAKDKLRRMRQASAIYDLDDKGNRVVLNDKQHNQAMAEAQNRVSRWCNE